MGTWGHIAAYAAASRADDAVQSLGPERHAREADPVPRLPTDALLCSPQFLIKQQEQQEQSPAAVGGAWLQAACLPQRRHAPARQRGRIEYGPRKIK